MTCEEVPLRPVEGRLVNPHLPDAVEFDENAPSHQGEICEVPPASREDLVLADEFVREQREEHSEQSDLPDAFTGGVGVVDDELSAMETAKAPRFVHAPELLQHAPLHLMLPDPRFLDTEAIEGAERAQ